MAPIRLITVVAFCLSAVVAADLNVKQKIQQSAGLCGKLLQVPAEDLARYRRAEFEEKHESYCFRRCMGILNETWDDEHGLLVGNMFRTQPLGKTEEEFNALIGGCQPKEGDEANRCYCWRASKALGCAWAHYKEWEKSQNAV